MSDKHDLPAGVEIVRIFGKIRAIIKDAATGKGDPFSVKVPPAQQPVEFLPKKNPRDPFEVRVPKKPKGKGEKP